MSDITTVFVVDPDESSRNRIRGIADELRLPCVGFATGEAFLAGYKKGRLGCVVAEFQLSGISGLELQEALAEQASSPPMLFVTNSTETELTVRAVQNGAITVLDKSVSSKRLRTALSKAVALSQENQIVALAYQKIRGRFAALPSRERSILPFALAAMSPRRIAKQLELNPKDVKIALRNIFKQTRAESVGELSQLTHVAGFGGDRGAELGIPPESDTSLLLRTTLDELRRLLSVASREATSKQIGELAHELSQPLSVITNVSAVIKHADQQGQSLDRQKLREWNEMVANAAKLATEILDRFPAMQMDRTSHRLDERRDERLDELVHESILLLQFTAQAKHVTVHCEPQPVRVTVDRVQIQQVVINLLKNAIDAASGNDIGNRHVTVQILCNACCAEISVSDNGPGIGDTDAVKMFDAFVSSKHEGRGLGLAISKSIVQGHAGHLWYQPNEPQGASFHVSLPRSK